jgi:hypothetical protein
MDAENRLRSQAREACADGEAVAVHRLLTQAEAMSTARSVLIREDTYR